MGALRAAAGAIRRAYVAVATHRHSEFVLFSIVFILAVVVPPYRESSWTICPFKNLTNLPCPGCGITRAFLHMGHLDFVTAVELNFICIPVLVLVAWRWAIGLYRILTGREVRSRLAQGAFDGFTAVLLVAVVAYGVYRLLDHAADFMPLPAIFGTLAPGS
jgi:multisubunit Na+/H+ antiporter MnhF subunit